MRECPDCGLAYSGDVDDHVCPDVDDFADEDDDIAEDTGEEEWSGPEDGPAYEIVDDNTMWTSSSTMQSNWRRPPSR